MSRHFALSCAVLSAAMSVAPGAALAAAPLIDPETKVAFPEQLTVDGVTYRCIGAGVRKAHFLGIVPVKVYAAAFCLEPAGAQAVVSAAAGRKAESLGDDAAFFDAIMQAPGGKLVTERFVRSVERGQITEALKDSLGKVLSPEKVQKLIGMVTTGTKDGEEMKIYSRGNTLTVDVAGTINRIEDAEVAQKLWLVFLGPDSVTPSLKASIAQRAAGGS